MKRYPLPLKRLDEEPLHTSEDPELSESSIAWGGGGSRSTEKSPHRVGVTCGPCADGQMRRVAVPQQRSTAAVSWGGGLLATLPLERI